MTYDRSPLDRLMTWYRAQCNGDWEHQYGVSIETIDNPGWSITIDTNETAEPLTDRAKEIVNHDSETEWMVFWVEDGAFEARGGANELGKMIEQFLELVA